MFAKLKTFLLGAKRPIVAALVMVATASHASLADEPDDSTVRSAEKIDKISDTWSRTVPIASPTPDKRIGEWRMWVEEGWLVVERRTDDDKVEWKIVLATVVGDEPPEILADDFDTLQLNYRDGRYFIRDYSTSDVDGQIGCLRCRRQPKPPEASWPGFPVPPKERAAPGSFGGRPDWSLRGVVNDSWYTITAGPNKKGGEQPFADCLVRLCHMDLGVPAFGDGGGGGGVIRDFYGKWFAEDDGELLVVNRLEACDLADELASRAKDDPALAARLAMKKLGGGPAPELSGAVWLNADEPPTLKSLRGKAVLLVLFDLRQQKFMSLAPPLLTFQETYGNQGLAIIGVYANAPRQNVAEGLADEGITFPVLIDDGKTAERYGVGYSACVLIDREGKVVSVYKESLAPPAEIEKLLETKKDATD